ncbi:hypothetical protein ZWY2020_042742 [Hordeum vulgare]|nr:hypothetical protein ZWY2020_042742 [Hordeum vulgare]
MPQPVEEGREEEAPLEEAGELRADGGWRLLCQRLSWCRRQKNIINLYAPEVVVPNNDLEKQVLSLRDKNEVLENQLLYNLILLCFAAATKLFEEIKEYKRQILYQQRLINESSSKRQKMAEQSSDGAMDAESLPSLRAHGGSSDLCQFVLQNEFVLDGARVMGIDVSSQIIVASGRAPGVSAEHVLTKAPGWSCSGDQTGPNHVYAGLQNGMLLVFDTRQTKGPLHSLGGLSTNPVHTIHSVVDDSGSTKIISASSIGPCIWDVDGSENSGNGQHIFAYGDESVRGVRTWLLPSFQPLADLKPHRQPILDLRFAASSTKKYLGCLSEEKLQVFRIRS